MSSLAEQLVRTGLVDESQLEQIQENKKAEEGRIFGLQKKKVVATTRDTLSFDRLRDCSKVAEFKIVARGLLLFDSSNITEIIRITHDMFPDREKSRKILVWLMYTIRDGLRKIKPEYYPTFLNRCLTKTAPRVEIKPEWRK